MSDLKSVVVEREFPHPPSKLWRALTTPHLIEEWLMKTDFVPEIGRKFHLTGDWGGVLDCEVLTLEPERSLAYRWDFDNEDPRYALKSVVTFTLTPTGAGTHLKMEQAGFRPDQPQAYGGARHGWAKFLDNLDGLLEREA
ncbi:SRPBCC domain-containing protein [Brevundimonas staleyi]|uniref:SRPBCC domain-containing protein n=1 Tax=Brevundimonas staleyi TaxID=74326 RepID=A0ABW0FTA5_9CAUL